MAVYNVRNFSVVSLYKLGTIGHFTDEQTIKHKISVKEEKEKISLVF